MTDDVPKYSMVIAKDYERHLSTWTLTDEDGKPVGSIEVSDGFLQHLIDEAIRNRIKRALDL